MLYHFDELQEQRYRVKPKESSDNKVPFFLFDLNETLGIKDDSLIQENLFTSNELNFNKPIASENSKLRSLLIQNANSDEVFEYLKQLSASGIESEMVNLSLFDFKNPVSYISLFIDHLINLSKTSNEFYILMIIISNFLKVNID